MVSNTSVNIDGNNEHGRLPENPGLLRQWLKQNVRGTVVERLNILTSGLEQLEQTRGVNRHYLECLDVCMEVISPLAESVSRRYGGHPPPLPVKSMDLSKVMGQTWYNLAVAYKSIVLDGARNDSSETDKPTESRACYAAIFSYGRALFSAYEVYRKKPSGIMLAIHQIYIYARDRDLLTLPQKAMIADFDGTDNTLDAYKRILLLDLADPYQLPFKMAAKADDMLTRLVDFASLRQSPENNENKGIFLIDPSLDQSGIPQLTSIEQSLQNDCQLLCTLPLIARIHSHIDLLHSTGAGVWVNPEKSAQQVDYINTLRAMVLKLGVQPIRTSQRAGAEKDCTIVVGANRLALMVHEKVPHLDHSELSTIDAIISMNARDGGPFDDSGSPAAQRSSFHQWVVVDETAVGMQLETETSSDEQLSVGEIVGVQLNSRGSDGWIAGVIRWIKNRNNQTANIGLLKLGWPAIPALVDRLDNTRNENRVAVFLPANEELKRDNCLVVAKGFYKTDQTLTVTVGDLAMTVKTGALIISSASGDCFEIDLISRA